MNLQNKLSQDILNIIKKNENILLSLDENIIIKNTNVQNRNIKQILGHMVDSASNNSHRIIHMQYQKSPLIFPDYANLGVNDTWIQIQNYQDLPWQTLVQIWKYSNIHISHIIKNISSSKLENSWLSALNQEFTLEEMIVDFPLHMQLHINQIDELIRK